MEQHADSQMNSNAGQNTQEQDGRWNAHCPLAMTDLMLPAVEPKTTTFKHGRTCHEYTTTSTKTQRRGITRNGREARTGGVDPGRAGGQGEDSEEDQM